MLGRRLWDVRQPDRPFAVGTGAPRQGLRCLTVGTDCSVGKMYTALALEREMQARGIQADFRATGQTGILIAGTGLVRNGRAAFPPAGGKDYLVSTQPAASLGVGYFPIRRLGVVVSYRHVFGTDAGDPGRPVQDALSAGLRLRF